jgi:hypothetical protein
MGGSHFKSVQNHINNMMMGKIIWNYVWQVS